VSHERIRAGLLPVIQAHRAATHAKDPLPLMESTSEASDAVHDYDVVGERAASEPAGKPFSLAERISNLKRLLAAKYFDEPPAFDFGKMREAFWSASSESLILRAAPAVAQAASDTTTALAWYGLTKATGMTANANPTPAVDPTGYMPHGLSARSIATSLITNTLASSIYEGTRATVQNAIGQMRASRRPRTELDPYQSKICVHFKLMAETRTYIAQELDSLTREKINGIDAQIAQCLQNPAYGMNGLTQAELLMGRRETLVGSKMATRHDSEWLRNPEVRKKLDDLADFFPDSTADELKTVFFDKLGIESRPAVFLTGRGGVGKTQFVNNLAAVVERPIVETTLEELLSPKFWGPPEDWSLADLNKPLRDVAGILHAKKIEFGRNDVMIVVNEADFGDDERSAKVADIKRIMDFENFKQYTNGGAWHDIDAIFVFTSNARNNSIEALCRRIPEVIVKSEDRQRTEWAEKTFSRELAELNEYYPEKFVKKVETRVRRDMDFIRQVGNATECGIAITGTVVKSSFRNAVRDQQQGLGATTQTARATILNVFRSNLGVTAYKVLDVFASNLGGMNASPEKRPRRKSL
jgi:hypothetical protein